MKKLVELFSFLGVSLLVLLAAGCASRDMLDLKMKQIAGEYELDPSTADVTQPDILNKMKVARIYKDGSAWKLDYYLPVREVGHYYDLGAYKHIIQDVYWNQAIGKYLVDSVDWSELDETDVSSADLYFLNVDSKELTIGKYHWIKRQ